MNWLIVYLLAGAIAVVIMEVVMFLFKKQINEGTAFVISKQSVDDNMKEAEDIQKNKPFYVFVGYILAGIVIWPVIALFILFMGSAFIYKKASGQ